MITASKRPIHYGFNSGLSGVAIAAQPAGRFSPSKRVIRTAVRESQSPPWQEGLPIDRLVDRALMDWTDDALAALKKDVPFCQASCSAACGVDGG